MEYRRLGSSDLNLSVIGMGCWQFGGGTFWGNLSQQSVNEVVHQAIDEGINYFDTAEIYNDGRSEISLGHSLKGKRNKVIIGSKVSPANAYPGELTKSCEASLKRLNVDYIDLYMLHWPLNSVSIKHHTNDEKRIANPPKIREVIYELEQLQEQGKIRHFGVSNFGVNQLTEVRESTPNIIVNQLPYNLFSRAIEEEIIPYCNQHEIGVIGYSPLLQGLLTGKIKSVNEVNPARATSRHFHHSRTRDSRHMEVGAEREIDQALKELDELSIEMEIPLNILALSWCISNPAITSTIAGSRNKEQLSLNLLAIKEKLTTQVIEKLNIITQPILEELGIIPDYYENRKRSRNY